MSNAKFGNFVVIYSLSTKYIYSPHKYIFGNRKNKFTQNYLNFSICKHVHAKNVKICIRKNKYTLKVILRKLIFVNVNLLKVYIAMNQKDFFSFLVNAGILKEWTWFLNDLSQTKRTNSSGNMKLLLFAHILKVKEEITEILVLSFPYPLDFLKLDKSRVNVFYNNIVFVIL